MTGGPSPGSLSLHKRASRIPTIPHKYTMLHVLCTCTPMIILCWCPHVCMQRDNDTCQSHSQIALLGCWGGVIGLFFFELRWSLCILLSVLQPLPHTLPVQVGADRTVYTSYVYIMAWQMMAPRNILSSANPRSTHFTAAWAGHRGRANLGEKKKGWGIFEYTPI